MTHFRQNFTVADRPYWRSSEVSEAETGSVAAREWLSIGWQCDRRELSAQRILRQPHEIINDPQTRFSAFLRVKLTTDNVAFCDHGSECVPAVSRFCQDMCGIFWLENIGMNEIHVCTGCDTVEDGPILGFSCRRIDGIPAHVWRLGFVFE